MKFFFSLLYLSFFLSLSLFGQEKRQLNIASTETPPVIDGVLDDEAWKNAAVADSFYQFEPYNGQSPSYPTEVKACYDDEALYFAAYLYDCSADSISKSLSVRDQSHDANTDLFTIIINPFNDGLNAVEFMVSAAGVQTDIKHVGRRGNSNWDAVWKSEVRVVENGWIAEYKIPYSALRFPKNPTEAWGIHFFRHIRRYQEWDTWNYVDNESESLITQTGEMTGIKGINPPLRLSLTPYVSGYVEKGSDQDNYGTQFNGGMDLKYGINESFTLDMTLIPDFGQVQSDDEVLNLSPFEVRYDEKRQFFTEGTELFSKGNIFYSRRIGSEPTKSGDVDDVLEDNEVIKENPAETKMINATKVSGRTDGGLGIGFFNAMTGAAEALIRDTITGEVRSYDTQGFTNYNMIVLDQNLQNNSYISFANTNVWHNQENYTANVSAVDFNFKDKTNTYELSGDGALSQKYLNTNHFGHKYNVGFEKIRGKFQYGLDHGVESDTYDPNDLGYNRRNNEYSWEADLGYVINEPFWKLRRWSVHTSAEYNSLYAPREFTDFDIWLHTSATFRKSLYSVRAFIRYLPYESFDYFESRIDDQVFITPPEFMAEISGSTDSRKAFRFEAEIGKRWVKEWKNERYWISLEPRFRFSESFMLEYDLLYANEKKARGFVTTEELIAENERAVFGCRDLKTIENTIESSFIFSNTSSLNLRVRQYWTRVEYSDFFYLQEDGYVSDPLGFDYLGADENINYNAFTIDLQYLWYFAPGSQLSLVWKNAIYTNGNELYDNYFTNVEDMFASPQINSFSIKILYYLDYNKVSQLF